MSVDEYADLQQAVGADVLEVDGVWWRKVRPFFYQPLFPFKGIDPNHAKPPRGSLLGGYRCTVPSPELANCEMAFFLYDDVHDYSFEKLNAKRRNSIRKGLSALEVKPVTDASELFPSGYQAYCSFYARSRYDYKKERVREKNFLKWVDTLFQFPKVKILGAYHEDRLSAVSITYLIEDVVFDATFFSNEECLKLQVTDLVIHTVRQLAARTANAKYIFAGSVTGKAGLDRSKLLRGCKIVAKPAFYRINPLVERVMKRWLPNQYGKIVGATDRDPSQTDDKEHALTLDE